MNWSEIIISVLGAALTALASWGVKKLVDFINSKISDTQAKSFLTEAVTTVTDVVKQTYQTYVESLKGTNAFTEEAQKTALANALSTIKTLLPEKTKTYLSENFGDIETWLTTQIEAAIYTLKNQGGSSGSSSSSGNQNAPATPEITAPTEEAVEPTAIPVPVAAAGLIYNGKEQVGVAPSELYTVTNGSATNAGDYTATVTLNDPAKFKWAEDFNGKVTFKIAKADYDMSGVAFEDLTVTYDGKMHSIAINGNLPAGVAVSYNGNKKTAVGTYSITASFTGDSTNYNAIADMVATLTITAAAFAEQDITNTISFEEDAPAELHVHLPALGKATFEVVGADSYDIGISSSYGVDESGVIEFIYKIGGEAYLPMVDDYTADFAIDKQSGRFVIDCTPGLYDYSQLLSRKWGSDEIAFSGELNKEYTYKMQVTSPAGKVVTVYLEQD